MIKFDLRLKQETIDSIKELAEQESRSVSGMARKILEEYFNTYVIVHSKETGEQMRIPASKQHTPILVSGNTLTIPIIKTDKKK